MKLVQQRTSHLLSFQALVFHKLKLKPEYEKLLTVPGIGKALGLTIMLETGPISRFEKVGDYTSYCRCVKPKRTSNGKRKKGKKKGNSKNGNAYLSWAYVEAANFLKRFCPAANRFYQRKLAKTGKEVGGSKRWGGSCRRRATSFCATRCRST